VVKVSNQGCYSGIEFLTAKSPEELKSELSKITDTFDLIALYAQSGNHVAWFVRSDKPANEADTKPKKLKK
jgi:hypothetical protein